MVKKGSESIGWVEMNSSDISPRNPIKFDVSEQLLIKGIGTHLQVGLHSINIRTALQGYDKISSHSFIKYLLQHLWISFIKNSLKVIIRVGGSPQEIPLRILKNEN